MTQETSTPITTNSQDDQLAELATILNQQVELYDTVDNLMQKKRLILVKGNAYELSNIDQKLTTLAQKGSQLEERRIKLLKEMGYHNLSLKEVIQKLSVQQAKTLNPIREQLKRSIQRVQSSNNQTKGLLQLSLNWVADTVELIAKAIAPESASYEQNGRQTTPQQQQTSTQRMSSTIERQA